jgi:hypothetical protein
MDSYGGIEDVCICIPLRIYDGGRWVAIGTLTYVTRSAKVCMYIQPSGTKDPKK